MARIKHVERTFDTPSLQDQVAFLYRLYFGAGGDPLDQVVGRAYLDLCRTAHRIGEFKNASVAASRLLRHEVELLPGNGHAKTQPGFDAWHQAMCEDLCSLYAKAGYADFRIGQAQKWINMTFKYIYVFGEERLPGYTPLYGLCHVPIDNIVLSRPEFQGLISLPQSWSRLASYETYLDFQTAVRTRFADSAPLAVEFHVWQRTDA